MKNKIAKERTIYNNYDLYEKYTDKVIVDIARECGWIEEDEEPSDNQIYEWRNELDKGDYDIAIEQLKEFFVGKTVGFFGEVGLWHGTYKAGKIGDFETLYYKAIRDCDYIKIYDENGHLYLTCSHHDGTNCFEIKVVTDKGKDYFENWEYDYYINDKRTEKYIHNQIYKRYSKLPRFAEEVWGCKAREYEPITKGRLIDNLNNQASSRYSA